MTTYDVGVIGGDGTGPEVVAEAMKVMRAAADRFGFDYRAHAFPLGGDRYLRTGELVPDAMFSEIKSLPATLLGAVGTPEVKPGILEKGVLLYLRFELDLYINLRPVKLYPGVPCPLREVHPDGIDFVVVRENTEGLYVGAGGFHKKGTPDEVAVQESINTRKGVDRTLRYAFEATRRRNKRKQLTLCGKTNVLTFAWDLWQRAFDEMGDAKYPDIRREYNHVDAITLYFVERPHTFDVIVTDNMFGDIITDLAAIIQGGLGVASGGNINPEGTAIFEPIGGSAPPWKGTGGINPIAAIGAMKMMLDHLGETEAGEAVERAMIRTIQTDMKAQAAGQMGITTTQVGDRVRDHLLAEGRA